MKSINKSLLAVAVAGTLGMGSVSVMAADGVTGNVALVSNYMWRGVTQSPTDQPTMQGGMDYSKGDFSFGTWGSSLDTAGTEIDFYGAYSFGPVSVGAIYYYYPGATSFYEANVSGNAGPVALKASYSPDYFGTTEYYVEAGYSMEMSKGVNLDLHAGYGTSYLDTSGNAALDYSLGVSGSAGGLGLAAVYAYSNSTEEGKAFVSVSKSM